MLRDLLNNKNELIGHSLKVLVLRVLGVFIFFALSLFLTNYFDAELIGRYDFVRSLLLIIGGITLLGTNQSIIYYSGYLKANNSVDELSRVYLKMISIIFLVSCLFFALVKNSDKEYFDTFFDKPDAYDLINKVIMILFLYAWSLLNIDMVRALGKTLISELFRNIFRYLPFFLIVLYLVYKSREEYLIQSYLLSFIVLWFITTAYIVPQLLLLKNERITIRISYRNILASSYPMAISAISYFMMQSVDIILLSKYDSYENVAYYAIAVKLAMVTALALQSVNIILAPKIAEYYTKNDFSALRKLVRNGARLIMALSLPALLLLALLSKFVLSLFGEDYVVASSSLLILLLGQLFNSFCGPVAIYLNMTGKQRILQSILIVGFLINLVLNIILIPKYGMIGAATATGISMIVWNAIATLITFRKDRIRTFIS